LRIVPLAPKKSAHTEVTEAIDCRGHLALEGLAAHFAVGHHFESGKLLNRDRVTDSTFFNFPEAWSIDLASCQSGACLDQFRRSEQAPNYVGMNGYHRAENPAGKVTDKANRCESLMQGARTLQVQVDETKIRNVKLEDLTRVDD
jgi:hypothetical protein